MIDGYYKFIIVILFAGILNSGCAGQGVFLELESNLQNGNCEQAVQLMENSRQSYGGSARLLYLLDSAMVNMHCKNHDTAQVFLHEAETLSEELWTESITRNAAAMVTSDYALEYAGEDYERVHIHLMSAIMYLQTGNLDDALVECRRLNSLLELINSGYEKKNVYREDAFARYLSGTLNEADGEMDDAFIDYLLAFKSYSSDYSAYDTELPDILVEDLLRLGAEVHRMDDVKALIPDAGEWYDPNIKNIAESGKVILIVFSGHAPRKIEDRFFVPTPNGPVGIAFPEMAVSPPLCSHGLLTLVGERNVVDGPLVLVEDINSIAVKNLDDRKGRIMAKTVARAVAKQLVIDGIANQADDKRDQQNISIALNILNLAFIERADTRSWRTLPGEILMARLFVTSGTYTGRLSMCLDRQMDMGQVTIKAGETTYLFMDTRYPHISDQD